MLFKLSSGLFVNLAHVISLQKSEPSTFSHDSWGSNVNDIQVGDIYYDVEVTHREDSLTLNESDGEAILELFNIVNK